MNVWQLSSNFRRDPSAQLTVLDEAKKPPKTFMMTKVYLTLRAEATFSSYRGNDKTSEQINSFKGSSKLINHSSKAWRKPFDSLLIHFETLGRWVPLFNPINKNTIFQSPKINTFSSLLNGKHTILHRVKVNKFHFLYLSGTVL